MAKRARGSAAGGSGVCGGGAGGGDASGSGASGGTHRQAAARAVLYNIAVHAAAQALTHS